jgi:uncharacterized membrane protein SpoIIM required for sporulation
MTIVLLIIIIAAGVMLGMGSGSRRLNVQHRDPLKQEAKERFEHRARMFILIVVSFVAALFFINDLLSGT